jgi:hypothetical protein
VAVHDLPPRDGRDAQRDDRQQVIDLPTETVPRAEYDQLKRDLDRVVAKSFDVQAELASVLKRLVAADNTIGQLRKRVADLEDEGEATDDDVSQLLEHWATRKREAGFRVLNRTLRKGETRWRHAKRGVQVAEGLENAKRAVDGVFRFPYQHYKEQLPIEVPDSKRRDDLAFIFRDGDKLDQLIALADEDPEPVAARLRRRQNPEPNLRDVHWRRVQRQNRKRLRDYLERRYGPAWGRDPYDDGECWPCPMCDGDAGTDVVWLHPLHVAPEGARYDWVTRCHACKTTDERLFQWLKDPNRRRPKSATTDKTAPAPSDSVTSPI